ncbi:hypothetical protein QJS10_CPA16g00437 [Acorus calamus]|uniref:Uncharacterized protein n=1 Tax=Acorus calamus TaxID=4465 RepID=A0AAV9CZX8_ACOCL|nr:hypothetical protein QJS10_CPA16g00437 [Acorus calamus]
MHRNREPVFAKAVGSQTSFNSCFPRWLKQRKADPIGLESISAPTSSFDGFTVTDNPSKDNTEIKVRME